MTDPLLAISLPLDEPAFVFGVLFLAVLVAPLAAERVRLPGIIGLIGAGLLVGPHGLELIERQGTIEMLGGVGLLYLMFQAGIELDLDDFVDHRRRALAFGATTFAVPMVVGTVAHLAIGFSLLAALLLASAWASHTLLAYPALQRLGVVRHPAVSITVGATIITDTAALLVLAVVAGAHQGDLDITFAGILVVNLAVTVFAILWVLPRVARWFFAGLGQARPVRFLFVVLALYASAALAEVAGIEAIVGAFLAGMALNRQIPHGSVLMEQIEFFGSTFLVPVFLISVGMLVDPLVAFGDPASLGRAGVFVVVALGSKWIAAEIAGRSFGFDRSAVGTMFSLSVAQAAATLAAVFVGVQVGLIGQRTMNAVVLVILVTCVVSSFTAARCGARLPRPPLKERRLGQAVLMPIANLDNAVPLARIAAALASSDGGTVFPLRVLDLEADSDVVEAERSRLDEIARPAVLSGNAEVEPVVRLDVTPTAGVLHATVEHNATSLLVGWKGFSTRREAFFGERVDALLLLSQIPVLLCRPGRDEKVQRVVLSVAAGDLGAGGLPGLEASVLVAAQLASQLRTSITVVTERRSATVDALFGDTHVEVVVDERNPATAMRGQSRQGDLIVVGIPPVQTGPGHHVLRLAGAVPNRTVLAVAPR